MAVEGIICQGCGIEAPSRYVEFHQNVGMLVMRQHSSTRGNLCKSCVHKHFWKRTLVTLGIGWLGTISVILALIFIITNLVRYIGALGMPKVPPGAKIPFLDQSAIDAIYPSGNELIQRINNSEPVNQIAQDIAGRSGVTPGQVILYMRAVAEASRTAPVQKTYGFPVQPVPPPLPAIPV